VEEFVESPASVLIIDDDPMHLRIYAWIIDAAGYRSLPALVTGKSIDFPRDPADLVVMDYRLTGQLTAVEAAEQVRARFPGVPIIVLSDMLDLPSDIAPYVRAFVRKGEPGRLVETLARFQRQQSTFPDTA
jgi:DNA-binding NtrC family response regulator